MPAIELQRLNNEIDKITSQFDQVDIFYASLVNLIEKYANWSFRPGKITYRNIQQPSYHTPPIVTQKLIQAIKPRIQANPENSLEIIRRLRQEKYLEPRSLAMQFLALVPVNDPQNLMSYVSEWVSSEKESTLLKELFSAGCTQIRFSAPQVWLAYIDSCLVSNELATRLIGVRAMIASVEDTQFAYLPNLYQLATGLFMTIPHESVVLLEELLQAFIERSPAETSFFLKQILLRNPSPNTARLVRKKLILFPAEFQPSLKSLLFDNEKQTPKE